MVTSAGPQSISAPKGETVDVAILYHDLGEDVMELYPRVIVAGVPATDRSIAVFPSFAHCFERTWVPFTPVYVIGQGERDGCPRAGDVLSLFVDSEPAGTATYTPATRQSVTLVIRGDSMRFSVGLESIDDRPITSALIGGQECGVFEPHLGFPWHLRVIVLSHEARPGCGRPGDAVRFYRGAVALDPPVTWRAGDVSCCGDHPDVLPEFHPVRVIAPETGAGPPPARTSPNATALAAAAASVGIASACGGWIVRRRDLTWFA
jgi:hypothetical protein